MYMTSVTQHFYTVSGSFNDVNKLNRTGSNETGQCKSSTDHNPRRTLEHEWFQVGKNMHAIFDPDDLDKGNYHISARDCTHNCMPGVSDITAMMLWKELVRPYFLAVEDNDEEEG
ncbi:MAG: hypothetical protein SGARI_002667 [Bacillariaceae sp.]